MPTTARQQDPNGFLLVRGCPISSYGVFQYSAAQVGLKDGDPNRVVNVFRPESAVNDPELIQSLQNVPVINDHEMLSGFQEDADAVAPEEKGIDGVLFGVQYQQPWLRGDVKVFSRSMQSDLQNGKKDLSLGYTCDFVMQSGNYGGSDYEVVQTNMRGNHIALVDAGRVPGAKILDHRRLCFDHLDIPTLKERQMAKRKVMDDDVVANLRAQLQALLPAFEQFLNQEAVEPAHDPNAAVTPVAPDAAAVAPAVVTEADPVVAAVDPDPEAVDPSVADPDAGGGDLASILAQLAALIQKAQKVMAPEAENPDPTPDPEPDPNSDKKEGDEMPAALEKKEGDTVEGLAEGGTTAPLANIDEADPIPPNGGKASPGPTAGKHAGGSGAGDSALRSVYADISAKKKLYERLSKVVGAFDAAIDVDASTTADIAAYGIKKLKLKAPVGQEATALDAYLSGVEAARRSAPQLPASTTRAADSASEVPAIAAYFKE